MPKNFENGLHQILLILFICLWRDKNFACSLNKISLKMFFLYSLVNKLMIININAKLP